MSGHRQGRGLACIKTEESALQRDIRVSRVLLTKGSSRPVQFRKVGQEAENQGVGVVHLVYTEQSE